MGIFKLSDSEVLSVLEPIAKNMQVGWDEDNYAQFCEHFSDNMRDHVNENNYKRQRADIFPELGPHKEIKFLALHRNPNEIIVLWQMYCSNRETPVLLSYFFRENKAKIEIAAANINY